MINDIALRKFMNVWNPRNYFSDDSPGFTLLEIMVAISVMAIVLVAVYRMQAQTIAMSYSARFYTTAPILAQSKMAEFENLPAEELLGESGDFGEEFPGYQWQMTVEDIDSELLGNVSERLKRIDVQVTNQEGLTYRFRTYRFLINNG